MGPFIFFLLLFAALTVGAIWVGHVLGRRDSAPTARDVGTEQEDFFWGAYRLLVGERHLGLRILKNQFAVSKTSRVSDLLSLAKSGAADAEIVRLVLSHGDEGEAALIQALAAAKDGDIGAAHELARILRGWDRWHTTKLEAFMWEPVLLDGEEKILRFPPEDSVREYEKGLDCFNRQNFEKGLPYLRAAAEKGHAEAAFELGCYLEKSGAKEDGLSWLEFAAIRKSVNARLTLGSRMRDPEAAAQWLDPLGGLCPYDAGCEIGDHFMEKGDLQQAEIWYRRSHENRTDQLNGDAEIGLARALRLQGRSEETDEEATRGTAR